MSPERKVWPWSDLGLDGPAPLRDVKRAYAARLKAIDHNDPAAFQALQQAFDAAKAQTASAQAPTSRAPDRPSVLELVTGVALSDVTDPSPAPNPPVPSCFAPPPAFDPEFVTDPVPDLQDMTKAVFDATATTPWDLDVIARVLTCPAMTGNRAARDIIEALLFQRLANMANGAVPELRTPLARLLEDQFNWASDGIRFRRAFGAQAGYAQVVMAVSRAQTTPLDRAYALADRYDLTRRAAVLIAMGLCLAIITVVTKPPDRSDWGAGQLIFFTSMVTPILFVLGGLPIFVLIKGKAIPQWSPDRVEQLGRRPIAPWVFAACLGLTAFWGVMPDPSLPRPVSGVNPPIGSQENQQPLIEDYNARNAARGQDGR